MNTSSKDQLHSSKINFIVGLGNPGNVYESTRHNVGFDIVCDLCKTLGSTNFSNKKKLKSEICKIDNNIFVMPQTFMNGSGFSVGAVINFYSHSLDKSPNFTKSNNKKSGFKNLYVIHDDLDIPLGEFKIQYGIGPAGHNGLLSIYQHLGTKNFWHIRVGIDTRKGDRTISSPVYVLQKFDTEQTEKLNTVKITIINQLLNLIK